MSGQGNSRPGFEQLEVELTVRLCCATWRDVPLVTA